MADYDIRSIFEEMELELIRSMKRNLSRHQKWEEKEKMNWTMWQAEQLKTLEKFKKENKKIFGDKFNVINLAIENFLKENYETAGLEQEKKILAQLAKNKIKSDKVSKGLEGSFFSLNKDKMNSLINATTEDFKVAEKAMLRMVNDQYRKTIYKAQVMSNSGAFTLKQSIDMATKDFLKAGINCIEYKNGRRVNIATYAEMALRTANTRAVLVSEGDVRNAYDVHTVRISKYGQCSETCLPWQGKIYVDDVWSGGTKEEAKEKNLPLLSTAMEGGLFHPNCRHRSTTYFYDILKEMENEDGEVENPLDEQEHRKNRLHIQQQKRLEQGSLDLKNVAEAKARKEQWIEKDKMNKSIPEFDMKTWDSATTYKSYTKYEIENIANENERVIDKHVSKKTKWTGQIVLDNSLVEYGKLWNCNIATGNETCPMILMHEQLHARSISYYDLNVYKQHKKMEEAVVQLVTQEICRKEHIEIIESGYDEEVDFLRKLNKLANLYQNDYEFALVIFNQEPHKRMDWLEKKVYDKLIQKGDMDLFDQFSKIMENFY